MKDICFDEVLKTLKGEPLEKLVQKDEQDKPTRVEMTLRDACIDALVYITEADRNEPGTSKFKRWQLACKISTATPESEFTVEEIAMIKGRVGKAFGPVTVGPVYNLLEGNPQNG